MLNKSVKVLSYTALSLTLLMGKITIPTGYFEDEGNFASVPSKLNQGWGFSFNKAFADCDPASMDYCIEITGTPPPPIEISPIEREQFSGGDHSRYDSAEDSQGDGGDDATAAQDEAREKERCKIKAQTAYEQCDNDATWLANCTYDNCKADAGLGDLAEFLNINGLARALKRCEQAKNDTLYSQRRQCIKRKGEQLLQCV